MNRQKKNLWKWAIPFFIMAITLILFKVVFLFGYVPTESMEPTFKKDRYIVRTPIYSRLGVDAIFIFHHDGKLLVKRIAAEEGKQVEHNGASLTVPENSYYVLGDNTEHSLDSRYWEYPFVKQEDIVARLIWP